MFHSHLYTSDPSREDPSDPETIAQGNLTKLGHVVKNWKERWMVLRTDGNLYYFKKRMPFSADAAKGVINIRGDCVELMKKEDLELEPKVTWPQGVDPALGFALQTRGGRTFFMYARDAAELAWWMTAIEAVGINMRFSAYKMKQLEANPELEREPVRHEVQELRESLHKRKSSTSLLPSLSTTMKPSVSDASPAPASQGYAHRVIGGVVIQTGEN